VFPSGDSARSVRRAGKYRSKPEFLVEWNAPKSSGQKFWEHPFQACAIDTIDADCALRSGTGYAISFPEPTCLLVSAKTQSSRIIHFKSPRFWDFRFYGACVPWFKTWCLEIKSTWMRIEWLCGTNPHWLYLWRPFLSQSTHAPWNRKSQNLGLLKWIIPELRVLALTKRHVGSGNEIAGYAEFG